jgi:hypothetical protein
MKSLRLLPSLLALLLIGAAPAQPAAHPPIHAYLTRSAEVLRESDAWIADMARKIPDATVAADYRRLFSQRQLALGARLARLPSIPARDAMTTKEGPFGPIAARAFSVMAYEELWQMVLEADRDVRQQVVAEHRFLFTHYLGLTAKRRGEARSRYLTGLTQGVGEAERQRLLQEAVDFERGIVLRIAKDCDLVGQKIAGERKGHLQRLHVALKYLRGIAESEVDGRLHELLVELHEGYSARVAQQLGRWDPGADFTDNYPPERFYLEIFTYRPAELDLPGVTVVLDPTRESASFSFGIDRFLTPSAGEVEPLAETPRPDSPPATEPPRPDAPPAPVVVAPAFPNAIYGVLPVRDVDFLGLTKSEGAVAQLRRASLLGITLPLSATGQEEVARHEQARLRAATVLFVYGHGIPLEAGDAVDLQSDDPAIEYRVVQRHGQRRSSYARDYGEIWRMGWQRAAERRAFDDAEWHGSMGAILVQAHVKGPVLPGVKAFRLNGMQAEWALPRGNVQADVRLHRLLPTGEREVAPSFFIGESVVVEVEIEHAVDLAEIPVAVMRNTTPLVFNGQPYLVALPIAPGSKIYRSQPFETFWANEPPDPLPGKVYQYFNPKDKLSAVVRYTAGFANTATFEAAVYGGPGEAGSNWRRALVEAARRAKVEFDGDWSKLVTDEAKRFWHASYFDVLFDSSSVWRLVVGDPAGTAGPTVRIAKVTVGDYAAMILLRETFVEMLREYVRVWEELPTRMDGSALVSYVRDELPADHPLARVRVRPTGPGPQESFPLRRLLAPDTIAIYFPEKARRDRHIGDTVRRAVQVFLAPVQSALQKVETMDVGNLEEMVKLTGHGFAKVEGRLVPRLMTNTDLSGRALSGWQPDDMARSHVRQVGYLAQQIRANAREADIDKDTVLLAANLLPIAAKARIASKMIQAAVTATFLAIDVADLVLTDLPDYFAQQEEVRFVRAAAVALDGERVRLAEGDGGLSTLKKISLAISALALPFDLYDIVKGVRSGLSARAVNLEGPLARAVSNGSEIETLGRMSRAQQADVFTLAEQAALRAARGERLSPAEATADRFVQRLADQIETVSGARPQRAPSGQPVPAPRPFDRFARAETITSDAASIPAGYPKPGEAFGDLRVGTCVSAKSAYSVVYEIANPPGEWPYEKLLKIVKECPGDESTAREVLERTIRGARYLEQARIPHARIGPGDVFPGSARPHYLQQRVILGPDVKMFTNLETRTAAFGREYQEAVVELYQKLAKANLVMIDGHAENLFFRLVDGRWQAGILDPDMIVPFRGSPQNAFLNLELILIEFAPASQGIHSMARPRVPRPLEAPNQAFPSLYPSAELYMAKMLERKGWVKCVPDSGGGLEWRRTRIDLDLIERYFPRFREPVDLKLGRMEAAA